MTNFWEGYFLAGMSFTLLMMGEISLLGTPLELMQFIEPRIKTKLDSQEEDVSLMVRWLVNILITVFMVFICIVGWPVIALYLWKRKK